MILIKIKCVKLNQRKVSDKLQCFLLIKLRTVVLERRFFNEICLCVPRLRFPIR